MHIVYPLSIFCFFVLNNKTLLVFHCRVHSIALGIESVLFGIFLVAMLHDQVGNLEKLFSNLSCFKLLAAMPVV